MATVVSLLTNPCNSPFDQQHSHHLHHHPQQLLFPPYGQGPETFQQRYSGTGAGGRTRNEATYHHHQQLDALDFHLLSRTLEEEVEQMEYSGSSGPYQYHQHDQQQQQPQQQAARRQGQQDFEQISPGYNLDNEDSYSGSPNNFQDYQNNFVDSPPDSKEPWPIDYNKMHTTIASSSGANDTTNASTTVTAVAVANVATGAVVAAAATSHQQQQQQQQQDNGGMYMNNAILPSRKRRMEWMSPQEEDTDGTETKIANIDKERDARRKG
uniref:Uncharacterized protein n=1 Tax=Anopheles maculatus TaxID=74869 RepID=A0A182SE55_9DIPT